MTNARHSRLGKMLRKPWGKSWRFVARRFFEGRDYTINVPYGWRVHTPWFDLSESSEFGRILTKARTHGPVVASADRCYVVYSAAKHAVRLNGHIAECGVAAGGTAQIIAEAVNGSGETGKQLHLFDTFNGVPDVAVPSRDHHQPGDYSEISNLNAVQSRLAAYSDFCKLFPGVVPDTFSDADEAATYAFVHIDIDFYPATKACVEWFWPRLVTGGLMLVGDYGAYPYRFSAKKAADEFYAENGLQPFVLPTGQAMVIKV